MTTAGGKSRRPSAARSIGQAGTALVEKALAPLADYLSWSVEALSNLLVRQAFRGIENNLCAHNIDIR
jgi:hypothetical protein